MGVRRVVTLCVGVCVSVGDTLAVRDPVLESVGVRVSVLVGVAGCEDVMLRVRPELADGVPSWDPELVGLGVRVELGLWVLEPLLKGVELDVGEGGTLSSAWLCDVDWLRVWGCDTLELGVGAEDALGDVSCEGVALRVRPELADGVHN